MDMAEVNSVIRQFLARSFEEEMLKDEDDMFALGFVSSMFAMQLVEFLESRFAIEIESDDLELDNFRSISSISGLVGRKQGGESMAVAASG